ncbi:MAG: hypothetical protein A3J46_04820 [Candidatus Yanofskybacteria bacterium RIFCSPHIGHO2_02_FULL_41_11]|uniref:Helix-turn-helix domain-containing protein n=1 Tax=Candidatus Yanofskybacteria bacterium RIFCSPHIGHO2_02_FULL_41_11 TaxID=1802675 RepID=A0A1F8F853_9BACT|nr:MAG: hypothetical protein A3J46_04820 [Candidatus Yanofskybacteria bacterium RIFCSPHIGHO2_02_FULL_41_11]
MKNKGLISTTELAKLLGISRIAVFKRIKSGKLEAKKIGRAYYINRNDLPAVLGTVVSNKNKKDINEAISKAVKQYGETFRLLGKE